MKDYTKKYMREMSFFIHPKTGYVTYNPKCLRCASTTCKQSYRVQIVACPTYAPAGDRVSNNGGKHYVY